MLHRISNGVLYDDKWDKLGTQIGSALGTMLGDNYARRGEQKAANAELATGDISSDVIPEALAAYKLVSNPNVSGEVAPSEFDTSAFRSRLNSANEIPAVDNTDLATMFKKFGGGQFTAGQNAFSNLWR